MHQKWSKNKYFVSNQNGFGVPDAPVSHDIPQCTCQEILFEGMTSISGILHGNAAGCNDRRILRAYFDRERLSKKEKEYRFLLEKAKEYGFSLDLTTREALDRITTGNTHGGVVAVCGERSIQTLDEAIFQTALPYSRDDSFLVYLDGIEDPYNFGYTVRSLYAAGVDGVILSPRNWMSVSGIVARSSAGTSEQIPMVIAEGMAAVELLRSRGYRIVCAGIRNSVSMYDANLKKPILLVVGGEKRGISSTLLAMTDQVVRIDYGRRFQGSLSAASAATVLAFEVLHQNQQSDA